MQPLTISSMLAQPSTFTSGPLVLRASPTICCPEYPHAAHSPKGRRVDGSIKTFNVVNDCIGQKHNAGVCPACFAVVRSSELDKHFVQCYRAWLQGLRALECGTVDDCQIEGPGGSLFMETRLVVCLPQLHALLRSTTCSVTRLRAGAPLRRRRRRRQQGSRTLPGLAATATLAASTWSVTPQPWRSPAATSLQPAIDNNTIICGWTGCERDFAADDTGAHRRLVHLHMDHKITIVVNASTIERQRRSCRRLRHSGLQRKCLLSTSPPSSPHRPRPMSRGTRPFGKR